MLSINKTCRAIWVGLSSLAIVSCGGGGGGDGGSDHNTDGNQQLPETSSSPGLFLGLNTSSDYVGTIISDGATATLLNDVSGSQAYASGIIYHSGSNEIVLARQSASLLMDTVVLNGYQFKFMTGTDGTSSVVVTEPDGVTETYYFDKNDQLIIDQPDNGSDTNTDPETGEDSNGSNSGDTDSGDTDNAGQSEDKPVVNGNGTCVTNYTLMGETLSYCHSNMPFDSIPDMCTLKWHQENVAPSNGAIYHSVIYDDASCVSRGYPYEITKDLWVDFDPFAQASGSASHCASLNTSLASEVKACIDEREADFERQMPSDVKSLIVIRNLVLAEYVSLSSALDNAIEFIQSVPDLLDSNELNFSASNEPRLNDVLDSFDHQALDTVEQLSDDLLSMFEDVAEHELAERYKETGGTDPLFGYDGDFLDSEEEPQTGQCFGVSKSDLDPKVGGIVGSMCDMPYTKIVLGKAVTSLSDIRDCFAQIDFENDLFISEKSSYLAYDFNHYACHMRPKGQVHFYLPDDYGRLGMRATVEYDEDGYTHGLYQKYAKNAESLVEYTGRYSHGSKVGLHTTNNVMLCDYAVSPESCDKDSVFFYTRHSDINWAVDTDTIAANEDILKERFRPPYMPDIKQGKYTFYYQHLINEPKKVGTNKADKKSGAEQHFVGACDGKENIDGIWYGVDLPVKGFVHYESYIYGDDGFLDEIETTEEGRSLYFSRVEDPFFGQVLCYIEGETR
ncbi:hypothetical protein [Vibrio sp. CAU 1672]|uniref:hypothetical protein n=1 Tax=Vibrio sp. CAU 1672 TaxID=3032594 RepID=UPI0023DA70FA|nr:hypothetical protein [Vibrio sp. CAU 1672]MDF2155126.1 hypothetical protein [Vibrio sp. CAU 1672]